jgi:drug/metabolite transporter (DMT)-like permease
VAHLAFIFCSLVWGSTFILLERVTHVFGPVGAGVWRTLCGAATVSVFWWFSARDFRPRRQEWLCLIFAALVFTAPPQVVQAYVLHQGFGHSFFGTMVAVIPLLTILVSVPMLGIWPTQRELVGVLGGLMCVYFLVDDGIDRGMSVGLLALTLWIPLASALSNTFIKWKLPRVPAAPLTAMLLLMAGLALVPLEMSPRLLSNLHISAPAAATVTPTAVVYMLLLGVVGSGISTMVFVWMILKKGPLFAGMTTYVVPVLAILWGVLDGEAITSKQMVAIVGVLAMVAMVQSGSRRPDMREEAIDEAALPLPLIEPKRPAVGLADYASSDSRTSQPNSQVA